MYQRLPIVTFCLLGCFLIVTAGCNDDKTGGKDAAVIKECPKGTVLSGGQCLRTGDDDDPDVGPTDGDDNTDPDGSMNDEDGNGGGGGDECDPECGPDKFCLNGVCRQGASCNAGEVLGCATPQSKRVCPDKGVGFYEESCPSDKPNCIDFRKEGCDSQQPKCFDFKCTAKVCEPGTKFCMGNTLMECSGDGSQQSEVKTCRGGCERGKCVGACEGNAKSYIGCGFYAVDLDNFTKPCRSNRDCPIEKQGTCSGGVCQEAFQTCQTDSDCIYAVPGTCQANGICKDSSNADKQQFAVTVSNTTMRQIEVKALDAQGNTVKQKTVAGGSLVDIDLPRNDTNKTEKSDKTYRIEATGPVTVHQFNPKNESGVKSNDASLLLPSKALGTEYRVIGWPSHSHESTHAYVTIVAVEEGPQSSETKVTVDTPVKIKGGGGISAISAGGSRTFTLKKGELVQLAINNQDGTDPTGIHIKSQNNKVAVFSGHQAAGIPDSRTGYLDHLEQQLFPVDTWDKEYVLAKFSPRGSENDIYRVLASEDGTTIQADPPLADIPSGPINAGEFVEFEASTSVKITTNKPVSVGQFMVGSEAQGVQKSCANRSSSIGDPAFLMNVPTNQYRTNYLVQTPKGYQEDYINFVVPTNANVKLDGNPLSGSGSTVGGSRFKVIQKQVQPGVHRVTSDKPVGLYSYGYECDVSYAYPGGLNLSTSQP